LLAEPQATPAESRASKAPHKKTAPRERGRDSKPVAVAGPVGGPCLHVVRRGESVSRIAARHGLARHAVIAANGLSRPDALRVGQRLQIPRCDGAGVPTRARVAAARGGAAELVARVGPARVPTRLRLAKPEVRGDTIAFGWPVDGPVLSGFGRRRAGWHAGVDIGAERGTPILAAAAGTVVFSGWAASYGRTVKIEHPDSFLTIYAHNQENLVEVGDVVEAGRVIGSVGRSGRATTTHLHFEIRRHATAYDPLHVLGSREERPLLARQGAGDEPIPILAGVPGSPDDEDRE
jgi:murein DD-endopeptidase MepM/ murein hydrolase activator NlpD